jgi:EmrB/QacA subfamily drug resistance transporter
MVALTNRTAEEQAGAADSAEYLVAHSRKLRLIIPLTVAFAFMMEQLDSTIITAAIPDIARSLGTTALQMNLAITSYILSLAVFIPLSGWFADRFGARRVFTAALATFTIASALCAQSDTLLQMVMMRMLQGFGGAMMTPVGRLILLRAFPRSQMLTAMTYMSIPVVIGPTAGPLVGGLLTTYASWRWLFYVNIPLGLIGIALALRYVEDTKVSAPPPFDVLGFIICGSGLAAAQFGIEAVGHPVVPALATLGLFVGAALLFALYTFHARRRANPVIDLTLFVNRTFRVSTLVGGLSRTGANAVPFMLPLMLQVGFGLSPVQSGTLTFVISLGALAVRPATKSIVSAWGFRRVLIVNAIFTAAVIASFALLQPTTPHVVVFALAMVFGLARSTQFLATNTLTYSEMPAALLSRSTSLGGVIQQLTMSFGVAVAAALLSVAAGSRELPSVANFHLVFVPMSLVTLASTPGFLLLHRGAGAQVTGQLPAKMPPPARAPAGP